ncbi:TraB/GumN family protein [Flavihumibacter rivuli]|uniref:TraB/GumN family protein n=1 Tax=Flavihumibacter rivuli TaxID=2838156 RepID=UPI001BDE53B8|nr:TraB/GumN family protein [Flavihumibacter rivuli]ULQ55008.1 TraB/GumN family protein [Flavihumibacter rivuli]
MKMLYRSLVLFLGLFFLCPGLITAQEKYPPTLLWRISGKGLSRPSYMYGTMHLSDRRLFFFGDSVYQSIEQCEGLATELDIPSMANSMMEGVFNNGEDGDDMLLTSKLSPAVLKPYKAALEKIFRKKLGEITVKEVRNYSEGWVYRQSKPDDMSTFVDIYLYDLANRQGKWVGGIEDMEDQLGLEGGTDLLTAVKDITSDDSEKKAELEKFISLYASEKIGNIDTYIKEMGGNVNDFNLVKRNVKMARRMDSLAAIRTCFFAVGAAHLPGDSGLITLMRNRGFTVEPVLSSKKIAPEAYTSFPRTTNWKPVYDADSIVMVRMPGGPISTNINPLVNGMKASFDFFSMSVFLIGNVMMPGLDNMDADSLYNSVRENFKSNGDVLKDSVISDGSYRGRYLKIRTNDGFGHVRLQALNDRMVMAIAFSLRENGLQSAELKQFLTSFKVLRNPAPSAIRGWNKVELKDDLLTIETPVPLTERKGDSDSMWLVKTFSGLDMKSQSFFQINTYRSKQGFYSGADSTYFESIIGNVLKNDGYELLSSQQGKFQGYPYCDALFSISDNGEKILNRMKVINRGNQRYLVIAGYYPNKGLDKDIDRFINSINFIPYSSPKLREIADKVGNFQLRSPNDFAVLPVDEESRTIRYSMYDSLASLTFYLDKDIIGKYYWTNSDTAYLREQSEAFAGYSNTLLDYTLHKLKDRSAAEILMSEEGTHVLKKMRFFTNGDTLYTLYTHGPREVLEMPAYRSIFESIRPIHDAGKGTYVGSKAQLLLNDLLVPDSAIFTEASESLGTAKFSKDDLPLLHKALLYPYADFDDKVYCTHDKVVEKVADVADTSTISFIRQHYGQVRERNPELEYPLLSLLAKMNTAESYQLLTGLMDGGLPKKGLPWSFYNSIADSTDLLKQLAPGLKTYARDTLFVRVMPGLLVKMLDSNIVSLTGIKPLVPQLHAWVSRQQAEMKKEGYYPSQVGDICDLFLRLGDPKSAGMVRAFAASKEINVQYTAVIALLKAGKPVEPSWLLSLAKSDDYRVLLYDQLKKQNKLSLFPQAYKSQRHLSQSILSEMLSEEDYYPEKISFLKEIEYFYKGKLRKFYTYKVEFIEGEGKEVYLGIVGPYLPKEALTTEYKDIVSMYITEQLDEEDIERQLARLLENN